MRYATFLLLFVVLPTVGALVAFRRSRAFGGHGRAVALTALIAFAWTVPWDNYLVYRGVWNYGGDRVWGVIGFVPVEEYAFFLLQPLMLGAFLGPALGDGAGGARPPTRSACAGGCCSAGAGAMAGALLWAGGGHGLYLGLILAWALPVLAGLWAYAGPHLWALRRPLGVLIAGATLWLWGADAFAIRDGIWSIADWASLGWGVAGLPVEEMTFFFLTNVLCVCSIVLFAHGPEIQPPFRRG